MRTTITNRLRNEPRALASESASARLRSRLLFVVLLFAVGCQKATKPQTAIAATGPASPAGWEVRYNAALALARRGSDKATDPVILDTLKEMLDEPQQLRNFRTRLKDGREVPDDQAARETVVGTLRAVADLHRKRPDADIAALRPVVAKLVESENPVVRTEAKATQLAIDH
ncbi:MAG: hypothetical protein U0746_10695 [Gemmataceae bacterium]